MVLEVNSNLKLIGRIHISTFTPSSQLVLSIAADNVQAFPLALTMTDLIKGFTHFLKEKKKKKKQSFLDVEVHFFVSNTPKSCSFSRLA
jgi:hypothetical protein